MGSASRWGTLRDGFGRRELLALLDTIVSAADPFALVSNALRATHGVLRLGQPPDLVLRADRVLGVAIGKASCAMAQAADAALGDMLDSGVVVVPKGYAGDVGPRWRRFQGGHPLPDAGSMAAAEAILGLAERAVENDVVLCLLSGGGSALAAAPQEGLTLEDLRAVTQLLLASSVPIEEMNQVRRHLTTLGGGGLARRVAKAQVVTLALSDVVGSRPESIASGPTAPDPSTFDDARQVLARHHLWDKAPKAIRNRIERGARGEIVETPKPGDTVFARSRFRLLADGPACLRSAESEAVRRGWSVVQHSEPIIGEAREVGVELGQRLRVWAGSVDGPAVWLGAGETTVTVRGAGRGGRNQELALALASELVGVPNLCVGCLATDGVDGPTDAAGALVDGETILRARDKGFDWLAALAENDTYPVLASSGDLLTPGPTGTNVADVVVAFSGFGR